MFPVAPIIIIIIIIIIITIIIITAILGTAHILRKVLMYKHIRANARASDMGAINSSDRIAATLYCLGT
jgi:hypothetical protein